MVEEPYIALLFESRMSCTHIGSGLTERAVANPDNTTPHRIFFLLQILKLGFFRNQVPDSIARRRPTQSTVRPVHDAALRESGELGAKSHGDKEAIRESSRAIAIAKK